MVATTFLLGSASVWAQEFVSLTQAEINNAYTTKNKARVSVHDPSVVYDNYGSYYIFGSHVAIAKTTDLQNWSGVSNNIFGVVSSAGTVTRTEATNAFHKNQVTKAKKLVNGTPTLVDFTNGNGTTSFDAAAWNCALPSAEGNPWSVYGNMWAPDVIYNKVLRKWCYYLSLNGPTWNSTIILMTSNNIEGPYVYQAPVVYTGFRNATDTRISWHLTDLEFALGTQSSLPSRYNKGNDWGSYWPHAIDPCVFYDEEGELWMTYGSWSGGIWALKLDKETGLRDYTVSYPITNDGNGRATSDPYFGKRIAGGYYVSGEASYVQRIGNYYYLFVTNGGLEAKGGYVMRVFRSTNPDGPYVDASGKKAIYSGYEMNYGTGDRSTIGNLLLGAYTGMGFQTVGEVAQGHNSAIVDDKGRAFVVYHTRFDNGGEGHQVRVHQLFTNEDGWIVAMPFEYNGERGDINDEYLSTTEMYPDELPGDYTILRHNYKLDNTQLEVAKPQHVVFGKDGKITGDVTGTWSRTAGTGYITITVGGNRYRGVIARQYLDGTTMETIGISALANNGTVLWAYKVGGPASIAYTLKNTTAPVTNKQRISAHIDLTMPTYFDTKVEWTSSVPEVISNTGKYNPADTATTVVLTQRLYKDVWQFERSFTLTAVAAGNLDKSFMEGITAYYDFDNKPTVNRYNSQQTISYAKQSSGKTPELEVDGARMGQVLHVVAGTEKAKNCGYVRIPNPLYQQADLKGFTVSMWVKRVESDLWGSLWGFTEKSPTATGTQNRFFLTENAHVGFTNQTDTFALNYPKSARTDIPAGKWSLVTVTCNDSTMELYVNQTRRAKTQFASTAGNRSTDFDYKKVVDMVAAAQYFSIGLGNTVASAEALYDDLLIYNRALSSTEIQNLYRAATRVTDFAAGTTGIAETSLDTSWRKGETDAVYDLLGRRIAISSTSSALPKGIYIVNGKKVLVK